jgi:hypothetical protein
VALFLIGTALHVAGKVYEVKWRQHRHYLDLWDMEAAQAMEEAVSWIFAGEHEKAEEAAAKLRLVNRKYVLFFDSIR